MNASSLKATRPVILTLLVVVAIGWGIFALVSWRWDLVQQHKRTQQRLQSALQAPLASGEFPSRLRFSRQNGNYFNRIKYSIDPFLQKRMEKLLKLWKPDYSAFVAIDAVTGKVLTLVSFSKKNSQIGNLNLRATFPAASVFKIVSAAAAFNEEIIRPDSLVSYNGKNHTLYKRNVTAERTNRWTRRITFKRAFALSINTVFGKLGMFQLKGEVLSDYAKRFFFNRTIPGDLPIQRATFSLKNDNPWAWAEIASGFNRVVLMSPIQGALMAATIANDGVTMEPHLVEAIFPDENDDNWEPIYQHDLREIGRPITTDTAEQMRVAMRETVRRGTARFAFRRRFKGIDLGGKTGSLKGKDPAGKCDWFVGYGRAGERRVAVAALTVDVKRWRIKAAKIASHFFQGYFEN